MHEEKVVQELAIRIANDTVEIANLKATIEELRKELAERKESEHDEID